MTAPATPIVLGLAVAGFLESCGGKANEFQPPPPPTVTVQEPSVRDVVVFTDFTGALEAIETVEVRARVKGFLDKMLFEPSGPVKKDDILFEIQPDEFLAAVHAAEAREDQAQAALDLAQVKLEKAQRAFEQDAATDLEIRQFMAERDAMQAELDAAKANVASVNLDLDYTKVVAPIAGRVSREYVSIGNLVGAGEATLLTIIVVDDPMYAYFNVDERALIEILRDRGEKRPAEATERVTVYLQLADGTDYAHDGKVDFGENRVDPTTGTLQVRAVFPNPDGQLFPGLFARVRLPRELNEAVLVPEIALQRDIVGNFVLVVDRDGTVERVDVELGPQVERERVIKSGLRGREAVIVNGIQRARPGITVTAEEADEKDDREAADDDASSMNETEETEGSQTGMFSEIFIRRPIFAAVISIVIVIIGSVALVALPIARYPEIAPPTVEVKASFPGANAKTVADTVATPLEQEINGVENMAYMTSTSTSDGQMVLSVTFEVGTDLDMANVLVQNRVSTATPKLPQEVMRQGVTVKKKSNEITLFVSVYSPGGTFDDVFLANYATINMRDELTRVKGVGDVMVFGVGDYSMRIWLERDKMATLGITTNDVVNAIRDQNVEVTAGQIGRPPVPEGQAFQYTVNVRGRLVDVEEFENILVRTGAEGQLVRVRDVARVELGSVNYDIRAEQDGKPACALGIYQLPGANAIEVADGVAAKLEELKQRFPDDVEAAVTYDATQVIRASMREVVVTLFITLALVVLTVYIFLQNFRATIIPTLTIPVSLIGTFAVMAALGYSINQLTMFGLVLVIGIVVDDAIVVVENVTRHLDEGQTDPKQAAIDSMKEVTGPVIATTLVLLSVFIPTVFMGGIIGQLFRQFAVTISIATIFSSINALTLSPALCGVLLRPSTRKPFFLFRWFNAFLDGTTSVYVRVVKWALRLAVIGLFVFVGLIGVAIYGFGLIPTGFVPQEDEGWALGNVRLPDGASLERTKSVMDRVAVIAAETPGVANVLSIAGYSILDGGVISNGGSLFIVYESWDDRPGPEVSQAAILGSLNRNMAQIQEGICLAFPPPSLPGVGMAGGFSLQLQDRGGAGLAMLEQVAQEFLQDGNAQSGLTGMYTGFSNRVPQLFVDVDREQVRLLGIPLQDVFSALGAYLGSAYVNDFTLFGRTFKVFAQSDHEFRLRPDDVSKIEVRTANGGRVPIGTFADVQQTFGPQMVTHHNIYPSAKINGAADGGKTSGEAMELITQMADQKLPGSMGFEWTELSYQESAASGAASVIFLFSVILVYLVLAAQYESWTLPISVCLSVPTALLGAVAALMLRGIDNNAYVQIGIVLLIGLAAKTAILIVEFAKVERDDGKTLNEAALSAAQVRFRAVLMTAFSFILGMIPLLVATGAGGVSRQALGTTVFGGMVVATVVSVVAVPMLFRVIAGLSEMMRGIKDEPKAQA